MAPDHGRTYDDDFYREGRQYALRSARRIVPEVLRLVPARSVVDVGCGLGTWLSVFVEHGATEVLGIDGEHVARDALEIPEARFRAADLSQPLAVDDRFDLAMSLEVAEHLPAEVATTFVETMCALAPVVLFSAAIPSQGGVHHVNEQWPDYWAARFSARGFSCLDCIRARFWDDPEVSFWYAQNLFLYVADATLSSSPGLQEYAVATPRRLAHPTLVERNHHRMRTQEALIELLEAVPNGARALVADDAQLFDRGRRAARAFTWIPFLEREGEYWGAPKDATTAIEELERMRRAGADTFVLVWPAFWWLRHYRAFSEHLSARYRSIHASDLLVIHDLTAGPGS